MLSEISDEHKNIINISFVDLKSVCDPLVKCPSIENCTRFITVAEKTHIIAFKYLQEYSIFPLHLHLHNYVFKKAELSSTELIRLLKCLQLVLSKSSVDSTLKFLDYSILLLKIVLEFDEHKLVENVPEDVKYEVAECLFWLYKNVSSSILNEIYNPFDRKNCHPQAVYFCTQVVRNEKLLKLRILALKCLLVIAKIDGEKYSHIGDKTLKCNVVEIFASMFPGIMSTCYTVITSDSLLHHSLFVYAIRVFSRLVSLIFDHDAFSSIDEIDFSSKITQLAISIKTQKREKALKCSRLTEEWYQEADEKLCTCSKGLLSICGNLHWKVRLELVIGANLMLTECSGNIKKFSISLIEILIILSRDSMDEVASPAQSSLKNLLRQDAQWRHEILHLLEENLSSLFDFVISSLNAIDENVLLSNLNLLNGYLGILDLQYLLKSSYYLHRLMNTLIQTVRFDPSSLNSFQELKIQELGISDTIKITNDAISWKNSKYLNSRTEIAVYDICTTLSRRIVVENAAFYLLDIFESNIEDRKEIIFLINNVILKSERVYNEKYFDTVKHILKVFLEPKYWSVPIDCSENDSINSVPLSVLHNNILQVCLLTEGIGYMAECLQTEFKPLLLICLYSIIENAGSSNQFISSAGLKTIGKITQSCGYSSITELITDNVDYVIHHVALKIRNLKKNKRVFDVLDVIILHCEQQSLCVLCDIISTLLRSSDILSDDFRKGFLKVFKSFVRKLRKWFAPVFSDEICALNETDDGHLRFLITVDEYVNKNKNPNVSPYYSNDSEIKLNDIFKIANFDYSELEDNEPINEEEILPEKFACESIPECENEKATPRHIQLIVSIANRLIHVLSTKSVMDKILVLEILMDTLLILCDSENQLLPLVHKIWAPLINRFKYDNKDSLILRRCFELLCIMAVTSRDFIGSRTLKEILPILNDFLLLSSTDSKLKDRKSIYRMSQKYKFQHVLLRELGHLSIYIGLPEKQLNSVLEAASPYLSLKQPRPLQVACVDLFKIVANIHYEFVWVHLMSLYPTQLIPLSPNISKFDTIKIAQKPNNEEFRSNVMLLHDSMK